MLNYQIDCLNWLLALHKHDVSGILADEMGLGKTLESIALLAHLHINENDKLKHLVIIPKSVVSNWQRELDKWCPSLNVITLFNEDKDERVRIASKINQNSSFNVAIVTYAQAVILEK